MAIFLVLPNDHVQLIQAEQIVCHDESHAHDSPIQNMAAFDVNGHYVEITQDGQYFHARVDSDDNHARYHMTEFQMIQFVEKNT